MVAPKTLKLIACSMLLVATAIAPVLPLLPPVQEKGVVIRSAESARGLKTMRIMCIGASITYGLYSTDGNGYRKGFRGALVNEGNTVNMVGDISKGNMTNNKVDGWPGMRIGQVQGLSATSLVNLPNLIILHVGTNDMVESYKVDTAADRLGSYIDELFDKIPGVTIICSTLLPNGNAATEANSLIYNAAIPSMVAGRVAAGAKLHQVDMRSWFTLADIRAEDGTHPTDFGYLKMAKVFSNGVFAIKNTLISPAAAAAGIDDAHGAGEDDAGAWAALDVVCVPVAGQSAALAAAQAANCGGS